MTLAFNPECGVVAGRWYKALRPVVEDALEGMKKVDVKKIVARAVRVAVQAVPTAK